MLFAVTLGGSAAGALAYLWSTRRTDQPIVKRLLGVFTSAVIGGCTAGLAHEVWASALPSAVAIIAAEEPMPELSMLQLEMMPIHHHFSHY